jgi:hypothetical protein
MLTSPVGLRSEKGCAGDAQPKLKSTDPASHQRGRPTSTNPKLSKKNNQQKNGKNWSRAPDGCLTPGRTGRLSVGRNITLTLTSQMRLWTLQVKIIPSINIMYVRIYSKMLSIINHK